MSTVTPEEKFRTTFFHSAQNVKTKFQKTISQSAFAIYSPLYLSGSAARQDTIKKSSAFGVRRCSSFFLSLPRRKRRISSPLPLTRKCAPFYLICGVIIIGKLAT
jgi:hypothetical protein